MIISRTALRLWLRHVTMARCEEQGGSDVNELESGDNDGLVGVATNASRRDRYRAVLLALDSK
jgi:hypothetical protein